MLFFLLKPMLPPDNFNWPFEMGQNQGKAEKLNLRQEHLAKYPFLTYSELIGGLFCKPCILFCDIAAVENMSGKRGIAFLNIPCTKYSRLFGNGGYVTNHMSTNYHKDSTLKAADFVAFI